MLERVSADEPVLSARSARVRDARQLTVVKYRRARGMFHWPRVRRPFREALSAGAAVEVFVDEGWVDRRDEVTAASLAVGLAPHVVDATAFAGLVSAQTRGVRCGLPLGTGHAHRGGLGHGSRPDRARP